MVFEPGDKIVVSGCANSTFGGVWPRWMAWMPQTLLFGIQWLVYALTKYQFGPRKYTVIGVTHGTMRIL